MESLFLTFPVMFHFLPLIITLKYTINNEKINHEFVLSQRKEITHVIGNVRVPITLRDNRKENFYNVPAIVKLLTKGQDMTVNQEITLYVYTHSFSILCWYPNELSSQTSPRSLAQLTTLRHPPIRNPSSESLLSLRGGLALIALETGFPSFLRLSEGGITKVIRENCSAHNRDNNERETKWATSTGTIQLKKPASEITSRFVC